MLMNQVFWDRDYTIYMLFRGTDVKTRLGMLHTNNLFNSDAKFEILESISIYNIIKQQENKDFLLRDYLLEVKMENTKLFVAAE